MLEYLQLITAFVMNYILQNKLPPRIPVYHNIKTSLDPDVCFDNNVVIFHFDDLQNIC